TAFLLPEVIEARQGGADFQLRSDLPGHEAVEHSAEEVSMAKQSVAVEPESGAHQRGVDQVTLGSPHEPGEAVAGPGGKVLQDEEVDEKLLVGDGRAPVDARGVVERLGLHH